MPKNPVKKDYIARLKELGEEAPEKWTVMELKIRISEIEEEKGISKQDRNKTELQIWTRKLSMASRKKADLQAFCKTELGMSLTFNETIPQLQKAAMERIYQKSEAHETDPVGFGNYSSLSYQEIAEMQGEYAQWVVATAREGQCCNRLMRLANWLEKNTEIKKKDGMNKNPPYSKANPKTVIPVAKAPSEAASCTGSTAALMGAMGQIMEQMKSMQSEMEELRGRHRKKPKEENSEMESWDAVSTPPQKSP